MSCGEEVNVPLYEYECGTCGAVRDIRHSFNDTTEFTCEACGGVLAKRFAATDIIFKGSGFYITDSRSGGETAPAGDTSAA